MLRLTLLLLCSLHALGCTQHAQETEVPRELTAPLSDAAEEYVVGMQLVAPAPPSETPPANDTP